MSRHTPPQPRRVEVAAERLPRWLAQFGSRHGDPRVVPNESGWTMSCPDGATAALFDRWGAQAELGVVDEIITHLTRPRRLGLVLVRKGGHAVGISDGPDLVASKVDTSYVQGRTKAGGWSQQRYARRRDQQATKAYNAAAQVAANVLIPELETVDAVVCGGDSRAVDEVFADPRLAPLDQLRTAEVLPTADPRLAVLQAFVSQARAVRIILNDLA